MKWLDPNRYHQDPHTDRLTLSPGSSWHSFLNQMHTARYLRGGEVLVTHLAERRSWAAWDANGRQGMAERAQVKAERLLAEHQVEPLTEDQERALDEIMAEAERALVVD